MSDTPFVSPASRFEAVVSNATKPPPSLESGLDDAPLPALPWPVADTRRGPERQRLASLAAALARELAREGALVDVADAVAVAPGEVRGRRGERDRLAGPAERGLPRVAVARRTARRGGRQERPAGEPALAPVPVST